MGEEALLKVMSELGNQQLQFDFTLNTFNEVILCLTISAPFSPQSPFKTQPHETVV